MGTRARDRDKDTDLDFPDLRRDAARDFFLAQHRWWRVLIMSAALSGAQCRVALALLQYANFKEFNRNGWLVAWPTQETIARMSGRRDEDSAHLAVSQLLEKRVISVRRKGRHNEYTFQLSWREKAEVALGPMLDEWPDGMLKNAAKFRRKRR
jgi:hypothetical protein